MRLNYSSRLLPLFVSKEKSRDHSEEEEFFLLRELSKLQQKDIKRTEDL